MLLGHADKSSEGVVEEGGQTYHFEVDRCCLAAEKKAVSVLDGQRKLGKQARARPWHAPAVVVVAVDVQHLLPLDTKHTRQDALGQSCAQHNDIVLGGDLVGHGEGLGIGELENWTVVEVLAVTRLEYGRLGFVMGPW